MVRKRSAKKEKNKMANKISLNISENKPDFSTNFKLEHKLILVTIRNQHPEISIDHHEIQKFLLIFNLLLEAELNKENTEDSEDGIPDIIITIATKLLELLHNNIDSLKLPKIIKDALRKLKSFTVKYDSENRAGPETQAARARAKAKPSAAVRPPGQRRVPRQRIGVKNIEERIRNRTFKIKRLLPQPKYVDVK